MDKDTAMPDTPETDTSTNEQPGAKIVSVYYGSNGWGVVSVETPPGTNAYQPEPCPRCPWRRDAPIGAFPPEVFRFSARTAYDLAEHTFGCHASKRGEALICAGFLLRGAAHNLRVRMCGPADSEVHSDHPLYDSYREMAIANGVAPNDPALLPCRDNSYDYPPATRTPSRDTTPTVPEAPGAGSTHPR